jgi:hypothetical protein
MDDIETHPQSPQTSLAAAQPYGPHRSQEPAGFPLAGFWTWSLGVFLAFEWMMLTLQKR